MTESFDVRALGAVVRLRFVSGAGGAGAGEDAAADARADATADAARRAARDAVHEAWSGCGIHPDEHGLAEPDGTVDVALDGDLDRMLESLSMRVTLAALEHQRGRMFLFHAAGIALDDGRVIAFVGPSGRGKTTLSRTLARRFGYVSDESIAVDAQRRVLPYRKPLSVVRPGLPKEQVSPARAGLRDLPEAPLRLAAVVLLDRQDEPCAPAVSSLDFTDIVRDVVPQMSFLRDMPHPLQALAGLAEQLGGFRRLRYARADDVPAVVDDLLLAAPPPALWRAVAAQADAGALDAAAARVGDGVVDAIEVDGSLVVFSDGTVRVLAGIAPAVWESAVAGRAPDEIVADVVARHGTPAGADPRARVQAVLDELVDVGVLRAPA